MRILPIVLLALVAGTNLSCRKNPSGPKSPTQLDILSEPAGQQTAGSALNPTVHVAIKSADGQVVAAGSHTINLAIVGGTGTAGAVLTGTLSRQTSSGIAVFDDLVIQTAGNGYRLVASATVNGASLDNAQTAAFNVQAGSATRLTFSTEPATTSAGATFANPVRVSVTDDFGNLVTSAQPTVSLSIEGVIPVPGDTTAPLRFTRSGATITPINPLAGTLSVQAVGGIATFTDLRPRTSGDYDVAANLRPQLVAVTAGLATATSARFNVAPAPASRVWASVQPCAGDGCAPPFPPMGSWPAGQSFVVTAYLLDSLNNRTNSGTNNVSIAMGNNAGGGQIMSTPISPTSNGKATFNVSLDAAGSGYTILAQSAGLTSVASYPFDITAAPAAWLIRDSLPEPRNSMFAGEAGGKIYVAAGSNGFPNFHNTLRVYDPATNAWTSLAPAATARAFSGSNSSIVAGVLIVTSGNPVGFCTTQTEAYSIANNTWGARADAPRERCHGIAVEHNGLVHVIGGWNTSSTTRWTEMDIYNPVANTWTQGTALPAGTFRGGMAAVVHNFKLYLIGGTIATDDQCTNTVAVFDFGTNTWGSAASMSSDRCGPGATVAADGRIYVAGGANDAGTALASVESYDPVSNTWRAEPSLSHARQTPALVRVGDRIYAIGGSSGSFTYRLVESLLVP